MQSRWTMWVVIAVVALLFGGGTALAELITEGTWFTTVGHFDVFETTLLAQVAMGAAGALLALIVVGGSARLAARQARVAPRSAFTPRAVGEEDNPVSVLMASVNPTTVANLLGLAAAVITGLSAATRWREALLFLNGGAFGWQDPVWGLDASFYVFDLPLILVVQGFLQSLIFIAGVVTIGMYVGRGVLRLQMVQQDGQIVANGVVMPVEVRRHIASLAAAQFAVMAIGVYLERYTLMYDAGPLLTGPGYAELNGTLPLLTVQAIATAVAAFIVFVGIDRAAMGSLFLGMIVWLGAFGARTLYPSMLQQFSVEPNELSRESPQLVDHIEATRHAFQLDAVGELALSGQAVLDRTDIDTNAPTIRNIRLWDHEPLVKTFREVQEIRTYYGFLGVTNDRYVVDGELRQIMLSPRELTVGSLPREAQTWVNKTMTYTHGYGVALGPVNMVNEQGLPVLWIQDLPPKVEYEDSLGIDRPEIYFGEATNGHVVVGTDNPEFDYPVGKSNEYTNYQGADGVSLAGINRLLFTLRFSELNLLFSGDINADSKIVLHRNVVDRALRVAPFVAFDQEPYMVVSEGRLVWVLDAYTHTNRFPYSKSQEMRGYTTESPRVPEIGPRRVRYRTNYLRNSVKVTVDAYDGSVAVWTVDESDPILAAWSKAYPTLMRPIEEMPDDLRAHMRYPLDQFRVQADLYATFHMQEAQIFYNKEDEWEVPVIRSAVMQPYYTIMRLPGETREEFILMLPFSPIEKPNLAAWMVARADGEHLGEVRVYTFPKDTRVYGPKNVVARISQDDEISEKVSLWNQQGSEVEWGTLLVIPIEESLIYVQPLYLQATQDSIPELKRVIVAYEDEIAMAPTLEEGLEVLFGVEQASADEASGSAATGGPSDELSRFLGGTFGERLKQAAGHYEAATDAARNGDWASYGAEIEALGEAIQSLQQDAGVAAPEQPVSEGGEAP